MFFYSACTQNEILTTVEIKYMTSADDHKPKLTLKLSNAMVREYTRIRDRLMRLRRSSRLTYSKFEFTWSDPGIVAEDDWSTSA